MNRIYLDHAAATPLDPRVLEVMQPYFAGDFANASSIHQDGQKARRAIDEARNTVMQAIGAFSPREIIFTGSGTESANMAIFGAAFAAGVGHIIVSAIEHPAVLDSARYLRDNFGFTLTEVAPNEEGIVECDAVEAAIQADTILVSLMLVNNELGTIQPVAEVAKICRERGILTHTDACQAPLLLDLSMEALGVDLLTLNGSKLCGPKGSGILYKREGVQITPLIHGGGQEFRMRAGTENTANIVGLAKALEIATKERSAHKEKMNKLGAQLVESAHELGFVLNGSVQHRLASHVNLHVPGLSGETLVMRFDMQGIAVSSGSACSAGKTEASHVLLAMGQDLKKAGESVRISLGRGTTEEEIQAVLKALGMLGADPIVDVSE